MVLLLHQIHIFVPLLILLVLEGTLLSTTASVSATSTSTTKRKILCLHGGGGNSAGFASAIAPLTDALSEDFEFVFANGGYSVLGGKSSSFLWIPDPPGGKDEPTNDPDIAALSVEALNSVVEDHGPFYGILGYSQGAAFVPVYLSKLPEGTFDIALTFCGYLTTTHLGLLQGVNDESPFGDINALVWMGANDRTITNSMTQEMATKFTEPTVIVSQSAGHFVPGPFDSTFSQVTSFIRESIGSTTPAPAPSTTTPAPVIPPASCTDRKGRWEIDTKRKNWCNWANNTAGNLKVTKKRCKNKKLYEDCPVTCDSCPTPAPSPSPVATPTLSCADKKGRWKIKTVEKNWCRWASRVASTRRCKNKKLHDDCPVACNTCPSTAPSPAVSTTSSPVPDLTPCVDRKDAWKIGDKTLNWCEWAQKMESLCQDMDLYKDCAVTCGSCA